MVDDAARCAARLRRLSAAAGTLLEILGDGKSVTKLDHQVAYSRLFLLRGLLSLERDRITDDHEDFRLEEPQRSTMLRAVVEASNDLQINEDERPGVLWIQPTTEAKKTIDYYLELVGQPGRRSGW